jgi:hypothetical protein
VPKCNCNASRGRLGCTECANEAGDFQSLKISLDAFSEDCSKLLSD